MPPQIAEHGVSAVSSAFARPERNVAALGVESGMTVADFGAGSGAYVFAIASRLAGSGHVYAIDIQADLLRRIGAEARRRGYRNVEVIWADLEEPKASKLRDGLLDLVLVSNLLFQVEDRAAVLREARRVLRDRGRLAIIEWSERPAMERGFGPHRGALLSKTAAIALAADAGFAQAEEFEAGTHHYGLLFRPEASHS